MRLKMTIDRGTLDLVAQQEQVQNCGPREDMIVWLTETCGETHRRIGIARQGVVKEVFASEQTESWTIIGTLFELESCLIARLRLIRSNDEMRIRLWSY